MKLTFQETSQLYVILLFFSESMDMSEHNFKKEGPARELARKILAELKEKNLEQIEVKTYKD